MDANVPLEQRPSYVATHPTPVRWTPPTEPKPFHNIEEPKNSKGLCYEQHSMNKYRTTGYAVGYDCDSDYDSDDDSKTCIDENEDFTAKNPSPLPPSMPKTKVELTKARYLEHHSVNALCPHCNRRLRKTHDTADNVVLMCVVRRCGYTFTY